jgi:hypothetical protein
MHDERDLDAPLIAYLGAAGFDDVHLTHGRGEMGKDVIAKIKEDGEIVQYAMQAKRGDIGTSEWRGALRDQMWEAVRVGITHPSFNAALPRQAVLVLTGRLVGDAQEQIALFNAELQRENRRPIQVWHGEKLVDLFDSVDAATIYPQDTSGYLGYGQFFSIYGLALGGRITPRNIERHSRVWLSDGYDVARLLIPAVEAATLAGALERAGDLYGAFSARLALVRVALDAAFSASGSNADFFKVAANEAVAQAIIGAKRFSNQVWDLREETTDKKLIKAVAGNATFATYPLLCTELGETLALGYFGSTDATERASAIARLVTLVTVEQGTQHVFGDRQAVSVVMICRALADAGEVEVARRYLRATAFHVLNLYANRLGMAALADDEQAEFDRLVGLEFPELRPPQRHSSFMITAIVDLCAHLTDTRLYEEVVNDIRFNRMHPEYYRPLDTSGQFRLDADDVVRSVSVEFRPALEPDFPYGEHLADEPRAFRLSELIGQLAFMCLSLLLRDRYFPTTWGP